QQFLKQPPGFNHYAPWTDPNSLLYRALDVLGTPSRFPQTIRGGRVPGSINLNTVLEPEIFQALCDSQDWQRNPLFNTTDVAKIFNNNLLSARNTLALPPVPPEERTPFQPLSAGDISRTWLRPNLFSVPALTNAHPYAQAALLQKIYNNITTTSN